MMERTQDSIARARVVEQTHRAVEISKVAEILPEVQSTPKRSLGGEYNMQRYFY